jgi:hypothetical protein
MSKRLISYIAATVSLCLPATEFTSPAQGLSFETSQAGLCEAESLSTEAALSPTLDPKDGATVRAGAPVTFSAKSGRPLAFEIASLPTLDSSPDIDGGLGTAEPEAAPSAEHVNTYTFTSTKATATPRTIYWTASFSDGSIPACAGLSPTPASVYVMPVHALTVLPAPPVRVDIKQSGHLDLTHSTVSYAVHCTTSCSGTTSFNVVAIQRHAGPSREPKLDLGSTPVSIEGETGGDQRIKHHYVGRLHRMLARLLHAGDVVKLLVILNVTDAAGNNAHGQRTIRLP